MIQEEVSPENVENDVDDEWHEWYAVGGERSRAGGKKSKSLYSADTEVETPLRTRLRDAFCHILVTRHKSLPGPGLRALSERTDLRALAKR